MTPLISIYETLRGLADAAEAHAWGNAGQIWGAADFVWEQMSAAEREQVKG